MSADGPIARTLRVLEALCLHGPQTLSQLAERVELGSPTTLRFLRLMAEEGWVRQGQDRTWTATLKTWRLGAAVVDRQGRSTGLHSALQEACDRLSETIVYATYAEGETVYVASAEPERDLRTHVVLGSSNPAPTTATGRCVLAFLDAETVADTMRGQWGARWRGARRTEFLDELARIRASGFAIGGGDEWGDLWGAAVPVCARSGDVTASIGTVMPSGRRPDDIGDLIAVLRESADQVVAVP